MSDNLSQEEILKFALENGMVDLHSIKAEIDMKKQQEYLKRHQYKIWKDGKNVWHTYLPSEEGGRKPVRIKDEAKFKKIIIDFYADIEKKEQEEKRKREREKAEREYNEKYLFSHRFDAWIDLQRQLIGKNPNRRSSVNTIKKHKSDYIRFFEQDEFENDRKEICSIANMDVTEITEEFIKVYIVRTIDRLELPYKSFLEMFSLLKRVLKKCYQDRIIPNNPCDLIESNEYKYNCYERNRTVEELTVSKTDLELLSEKLAKDRIDKPDYITNYTIIFACLTGMRPGEISALEWSHIHDDEGYILVKNSEKIDNETRERFISTTKTRKERRVPLTDAIRQFLEQLREVEAKYGFLSEFVFSDARGRISKDNISANAGRKCKQAGIKGNKCIYSFRRTVNSEMKLMGATGFLAGSIIGNSSRVNDTSYTYDISSNQIKKEYLERVNSTLTLKF